jgi:ATP-dependent protease Clp ATPase subunit
MTDETYCNGCGKFHTEVEAMIAMAGSIFVCNECVNLLHDIAQKKEREDPVRIKKREIKLEELNRIHADLSALLADVNRRLDWIESQIKLLTQGFGI